MTEETRICPFVSDGNNGIACQTVGCMAWREIDHNDWDCVLLRNKKCQ
jgi:hypothetical protein